MTTTELHQKLAHLHARYAECRIGLNLFLGAQTIPMLYYEIEYTRKQLEAKRQ